MSKEIYISTTPHETRLAIVEDEQLAEIYFERENEYTLAGSIYNGRVTRVLPGMQSSFVDVGLERDAFLYVTDFMEEQGDAADFDSDGNRRAVKDSGRETAPRDGNREISVRDSNSRDGERRGRGDRERGRQRERPVAVEPAGETRSFEEPIAPHPVATESPATGSASEQDNLTALDDQGSRRWRGRRGRRRGRTGRDDIGTQGAGTENVPETTGPSVLESSMEDDSLMDDESLILEGSAESDEVSGGIEIDMSATPREPEGPNYGYSRRIRENRREERARERGLTPGQERRLPVDSSGSEGREAAGSSPTLPMEGPAAGTSVPFVLPGESIRKYRNPAELAEEDRSSRSHAPSSAETVLPAATSVEIVGWDGGAVLPGESLSKHRRREQGSFSAASRGSAGLQSPAAPVVDQSDLTAGNGPRAASPALPVEVPFDQLAPESSQLGPSDAAEEDLGAPTPIPDVAAIASAAAPDETGGLTQHPAHADERAAVGPVVESDPAIPQATSGAYAPTQSEPKIVTASAEYEPAEGESVSLGERIRRELRRFGRRSEERPKAEVAATAEPLSNARQEAADQEAAAEEIPDRPDATVYDLHAHSEAQATTGEQEALPATTYVEVPAVSVTSVEAVTPAEAGISAPAVASESAPDVTTLEATGEMRSEPSGFPGESLHGAPLPQDLQHAPTPAEVESAGFPVTEDRADVSANQASFQEDLGTAQGEDELEGLPQMHAYGDGDLEEEEVDGDEYEYDLALASLEEDEFDEYEEETLEGTGDAGELLQEMALEQSAQPASDVEEEAGETFIETGGFTVDDFGGEPEEDLPVERGGASPTGTTEIERRGRRDVRRGGRDRERGSSAGSGGGFRGGAGGDRGRGRGGRPSVQTQDLPAINDLLKPGQEVLVQIAKEPIAKKGARITSHIALPGRFLVFMPTVHHTGVSRKISSDEERRRLKSILLSEKGDAQGGFIVRTAADGASEEELRNDLRFLIQLWQDIKTRSESSKAPALIYHDLSLIERILRDQVTDNFSAIWVDTESEYERVLRFLQRFQPSLVRRVKLYTKETPIFEHFGVTPEIDRALKSKVWLKSGGSIVIDQTEALVAIDINTGKYVGKTARLEDTILKTNLDAIPEIVRQIRLRDLGGIIVIDFIDMDERKNRAKVMQVLEDELRADRAPSKVLPFNDFGLVIMTRKRVKQSLERTLCIPDPITEGTGMIKSPITVANEIFVEMRKMHRHLERNDILLRVHPEVVKQLKSAGGKRLQELEEMTRKTILVKSDPTLNPEQFDIH